MEVKQCPQLPHHLTSIPPTKGQMAFRWCKTLNTTPLQRIKTKMLWLLLDSPPDHQSIGHQSRFYRTIASLHTGLRVRPPTNKPLICPPSPPPPSPLQKRKTLRFQEVDNRPAQPSQARRSWRKKSWRLVGHLRGPRDDSGLRAMRQGVIWVGIRETRSDDSK